MNVLSTKESFSGQELKSGLFDLYQFTICIYEPY